MKLLLLLLSCSGKGEDVPVAPKSLVTYNVGLAVGFVPAARDRADQAFAAIAALEDDVVCLQEIWLPEHVSAMQAAALDSFPHQYFPEPSQDVAESAACLAEDLDPLIECADTNCADACEDELVDCIFDSCSTPFLLLPYECMDCAMAMVGGEVSDVSDTCLSNGVSFAYGGSYGTGLLSKWPIKSTELLTMESTTNRRGVIHAVIEAPDGDMDVYCTHLTAVFTRIPYPSFEGSWEEEQGAQISEMRDWIDSSAGTGRVVLMGDMNTGPEGEGIDGEVAAHWDLLSPGYTTPYLDGAPTCTYCDNNPLNGGDHDGGVVIDHIMLRGMGGSFTAERILDQSTTALSCEVEIPATLSDHYGVRVEISP